MYFHRSVLNCYQGYSAASAHQTEGWEGCTLDYGAFIEPITDRLFNLALPIICEDLPPILCPDPLPAPAMPDWGLGST